MQIDGKVTTRYQIIAEKCNHSYVSVANNINNNKSTTDHSCVRQVHTHSNLVHY